MEGDNEYMIMDTDQWDIQDNTYESGDALGLDIGGSENSGAQEKGPDSGQKKKGKAATDSANNAQPPVLPDRYQTLRWPPPGKNRRLSKINNLVFFRSTAVWLVVLCTVLIGLLIALGTTYTNLTGAYITKSEEIKQLVKDNEKLRRDKEIIENRSRLVYRVSTAEYPDCLSGNDLVILNYGVLEEHVKNGSFFLYRSMFYGGSCHNQFSWNCTC